MRCLRTKTEVIPDSCVLSCVVLYGSFLSETILEGHMHEPGPLYTCVPMSKHFYHFNELLAVNANTTRLPPSSPTHDTSTHTHSPKRTPHTTHSFQKHTTPSHTNTDTHHATSHTTKNHNNTQRDTKCNRQTDSDVKQNVRA